MSGERGSILIEALVSAAIVAMLLAMTYQTVAGSAARARSAERNRQALMVAESTLSAVGAAIPAYPGSSSGRQGDLVWQTDIEPYASGGGAGVGGLYSVTVTVRSAYGGRPLASLQSLRVGPA
jgi:type II secretory pathway pseudopilin PulG